MGTGHLTIGKPIHPFFQAFKIRRMRCASVSCSVSCPSRVFGVLALLPDRAILNVICACHSTSFLPFTYIPSWGPLMLWNMIVSSESFADVVNRTWTAPKVQSPCRPDRDHQGAKQPSEEPGITTQLRVDLGVLIVVRSVRCSISYLHGRDLEPVFLAQR